MVPNEFKILNHTILVVVDNEYCYKNDCYGQFFSDEDKIIVATKYKKNNKWVNYKPEIVKHTLYHEIVHCILYYMHHELWDNETFVDQFSGLLCQIINTKK